LIDQIHNIDPRLGGTRRKRRKKRARPKSTVEL